MEEEFVPQLKGALLRAADLACMSADVELEQLVRRALVRAYQCYPQRVEGESLEFQHRFRAEYVPAGALCGGNYVRAAVDRLPPRSGEESNNLTASSAVLHIDSSEESSGEGTLAMYGEQG